MRLLRLPRIRRRARAPVRAAAAARASCPCGCYRCGCSWLLEQGRQPLQLLRLVATPLLRVPRAPNTKHQASPVFGLDAIVPASCMLNNSTKTSLFEHLVVNMIEWQKCGERTGK